MTAGGRISASRIVRDGVRVVGQAGAFLAGASPAQREQVVMIDETFLAVVVTALGSVDGAQRQVDARKRASPST